MVNVSAKDSFSPVSNSLNQKKIYHEKNQNLFKLIDMQCFD